MTLLFGSVISFTYICVIKLLTNKKLKNYGTVLQAMYLGRKQKNS
jgi:hypothetical protein